MGSRKRITVGCLLQKKIVCWILNIRPARQGGLAKNAVLLRKKL